MTRWPRAFSSEAASAKAETSAIALSLSYLSSWARSKTVDALDCSLIGPGRTSSLNVRPDLHRRHHGIHDLVEEGVHLRLALARDRGLVRHHHLRDRELVRLGVLAQLLHRGVRILGRILLRRRVALPFDEAAAHRVVLELVDRLVAAHQLAGHGVGMGKVALGRVVDDVGKRQVERLVAELDRIGLLGLVAHLVEEQRIDRGRLLAQQPGKRRTLGAVALAGRAEAAEQVHLQPGGLGELVGRQLGAALVEVVGDAHRPDRVRARGPRADLVELVGQDHHRALRGLHHIEVGRQRPAELRAGRFLRGLLRARPGVQVVPVMTPPRR